MTNYLNVEQVCEETGMSVGLVRALCREGSYRGAIKRGGRWNIPLAHMYGEPHDWFPMSQLVAALERRLLGDGRDRDLSERGFVLVDLDLHEQVIAVVDWPDGLDYLSYQKIDRPSGETFPASLREILEHHGKLSLIAGFHWDNPGSGGWPLCFHRCRIAGMSSDLILTIQHPYRIRVHAAVSREAGHEVHREVFSNLLTGDEEHSISGAPYGILLGRSLLGDDLREILFERFKNLEEFSWAGLADQGYMEWLEHDLFELAAGHREDLAISETYDEEKRRQVFDEYFDRALNQWI